MPSGQELHQAARKAPAASAGGSDGWRPAELKWLPQQAWDMRSTLLQLCTDLQTFPEAYADVIGSAIPKADGGPDPIKQRLLTIFSAV